MKIHNPLYPTFSLTRNPNKEVNISIKDWKTGKEVFRQDAVKVPEDWSDTAATIACSRWFRGKVGTPERETSTEQMFRRVAEAICNFGADRGYFSQEDNPAWIEYLVALQQDQRAVFNTPVYLNAGWSQDPRTSACFLLAVEDNYESLTNHGKVESKVFQHGGGAGVYVGNISHEGRALSRGGYASGPLPFNEGWDRSSGAIKSGGSHRRAARDVTLDVRHPDCYRSKEYLASLPVSALDTDFIREKQNFEQIRKDLATLGYDVSMNSLIDYVLPSQNANRAVLVYDEFLVAVKENAPWDVKCPRSGEVVWTYPAKEVWDALCYATWFAADPTVKFYDNINRYNMCTRGEIRVGDQVYTFDGMVITTSNPCLFRDMRMDTPDGLIPIGDLADRTTCKIKDATGVYRNARVWYTGDKECIKLSLMGLKEIIVTPDHRLMLEDGSPIQAQDTLGKEVRVVELDDPHFHPNACTLRVTQIEDVGAFPVYDFEMLEGEHWGVCEGVVVHNCNEVIYPVPTMSEAAISCNLAMLRLTKYINLDGEFDHPRYFADAQFMLTLQDILVDYASYPTELCDKWTKANRILGLSLSDLGGLLMAMGLPYDSKDGRLFAETVAALHFYAALHRSAQLAEELGACENYERNADNVKRVLDLHYGHLTDLCSKHKQMPSLRPLLNSLLMWADLCHEQIAKTGLRNMQVVSYAPQGTTGMITDCYATGMEPMIAPISYKTLSGGGTIKQAPPIVRIALAKALDDYYSDHITDYIDGTSVDALVEDRLDAAFEYLTENGTLFGFDHMTDEYDSIFATALGIHTKDGVKLSVHPNGHVGMMAALQHFVSAAISKTCNVPSTYTPKDISDIYFRAWEKGVKAISIYRDGCKGAQPVKITKDEDTQVDHESDVLDSIALQTEVDRLRAELAKANVPVPAKRVKLPDSVCSVRKKLKLDGHEIYMHVGLFADGSIGEVFITGIQGTFVAGMLDAFATLLSLGLQYGIPFEDLYRKFEAVYFAPQGFNAEIQGYASSLPSLIVKTLRKGLEDGSFKRYANAYYGETPVTLIATPDHPQDHQEDQAHSPTSDPCPACGSLMVQTGKCKTCTSCGYNNGACG